MSNLGFSKKLRLLSAADYQPVFKNALYKVSCQQILLLANDSDTPYPRLGLVIAKKNIPKAVDRNRVKRIFRESFRHNQHLLPKLDIVILARSGLGALDNKIVQNKIDNLWKDLNHKAARASISRDRVHAG